jgi:hypothetical protein
MRSAEALNSRMVPSAADRDHAVHGGGQQGAHPGFAARQLLEQLAVAQQAVGAQHEDGEGHRDQGDRQRQEGVGSRLLRGQRGLSDEARGFHAGVVHAGDGAAHHDGRQEDAASFAQAVRQAGEAEAHPQRQRRQHHRDHDRQQEHADVVVQLEAHAHARHAGVVHHADAGADHHAARQQAPAAQALARDQPQRDEGSGDARHARDDGGDRVVVDVGAQVEGEHADEVHGPHAGAQRQAAAAEHDPALAAVDGGLAGDQQRHPGGEDRHQHRQDHQARRIHPVAEQGWVVGHVK